MRWRHYIWLNNLIVNASVIKKKQNKKKPHKRVKSQILWIDNPHVNSSKYNKQDPFWNNVYNLCHSHQLFNGGLYFKGIRRVWIYTKGVIRIRISKNRHNNGQKKKYKRTNNDLQHITHKTKDQVTRTPLKTGVNSCSGGEGLAVPVWVTPYTQPSCKMMS